MSGVYACTIRNTTIGPACCAFGNGTVVDNICRVDRPEPYAACVMQRERNAGIVNNSTNADCRLSSATRQTRLSMGIFFLVGLLVTACVNAQSLTEIIAADAAVLGLGADAIWANRSIVKVEDVDPSAILREHGVSLARRRQELAWVPGAGYNNVTYEYDPWAISVTYDRSAALGEQAELDKRQCHYKLYIKETFLDFWRGEWDDDWVGHCDVYAWRGSSSCLTWSLSHSTKYSIGLSIGWKSIISARIGAQRDTTTTAGRAICVESHCNCQRLWTQNKMRWAHGTMYTDTFESTTCDVWNQGGRLIKTDRVDNIHIDFGKTDGNGLLVVVPGGSPCSDGPSQCGEKSWGCGR